MDCVLVRLRGLAQHMQQRQLFKPKAQGLHVAPRQKPSFAGAVVSSQLCCLVSSKEASRADNPLAVFVVFRRGQLRQRAGAITRAGAAAA